MLQFTNSCTPNVLRCLTFKTSTLNNDNLAMIFRLDLKQGIYISSDEREIILPSDTGFDDIEDLRKTYFVNGERKSPNSTNCAKKRVSTNC